MNRSPYDDAVAAYVRRARDEMGGNLAELVRRVEAELGREYARNAGQGWLKQGNAPGRVLFALRHITGLSLDAAAEALPLSAGPDRITSLERRLVDLEQRLREAGIPYRPTRDRQGPDDISAQAP